MYGVVLCGVSGSRAGRGGRGGARGSAGQIIRAAVRDEGWPTCKQVTSVPDDNS